MMEEYKDELGLPTSKRALAQEFWLQTLNAEERYEIMQQVGDHSEIDAKYEACLVYIIDNLLVFEVSDKGVLTAKPKSRSTTPGPASCLTCGKAERPEMDARAASEESSIELKHYLFCPDCFHCLSQREMKALTERREGMEMRAHYFNDGHHHILRIVPSDLQELIFRCGWLVTEHFEGLTIEALAELERLEGLPEIVSEFSPNVPNNGYLQWWKDRLISKEPCGLTPDM